jgi:hypothetical protein
MEHRVFLVLMERMVLLVLRVRLEHQELTDHLEPLVLLVPLVLTALDLSLQDLGILIPITIKMMLFTIKVAVMFLYRVFRVMVQYY